MKELKFVRNWKPVYFGLGCIRSRRKSKCIGSNNEALRCSTKMHLFQNAPQCVRVAAATTTASACASSEGTFSHLRRRGFLLILLVVVVVVPWPLYKAAGAAFVDFCTSFCGPHFQGKRTTATRTANRTRSQSGFRNLRDSPANLTLSMDFFGPRSFAQVNTQRQTSSNSSRSNKNTTHIFHIFGIPNAHCACNKNETNSLHYTLAAVHNASQHFKSASGHHHKQQQQQQQCCEDTSTPSIGQLAGR